jgi:hypothetical protein
MSRDVGFPRHGFPISHVNRVVNRNRVTVGTPGGRVHRELALAVKKYPWQ